MRLRFFNNLIYKIGKNIIIFILHLYVPLDISVILDNLDNNINNDWLKYKMYLIVLFSATLVIYIVLCNNGASDNPEISNIEHPILYKHW